MGNLFKQDTRGFLESIYVKKKLDFWEKYEYPALTLKLLTVYKEKQPFRVACGKSKWVNYEKNIFSEKYNLREILKDEIVFELDDTKFKGTLEEFKAFAWDGIIKVGNNLYNAGYSFSIWDHEGKSPHLHVHDLPITHYEKDKLRAFKKFFITKFTPEEYLPYVDFSLCGVHLVALEWCEHWKGCYGIKKLINEFKPSELKGGLIK